MVTEMCTRGAILAHALDVEVLDALAAAQALEDVALLVAQIRRHDQVDRLADRLLQRAIRTAAPRPCSRR